MDNLQYELRTFILNAFRFLNHAPGRTRVELRNCDASKYESVLRWKVSGHKSVLEVQPIYARAGIAVKGLVLDSLTKSQIWTLLVLILWGTRGFLSYDGWVAWAILGSLIALNINNMLTAREIGEFITGTEYQGKNRVALFRLTVRGLIAVVTGWIGFCGAVISMPIYGAILVPLLGRYRTILELIATCGLSLVGGIAIAVLHQRIDNARRALWRGGLEVLEVQISQTVDDANHQ